MSQDTVLKCSWHSIDDKTIELSFVEVIPRDDITKDKGEVYDRLVGKPFIFRVKLTENGIVVKKWVSGETKQSSWNAAAK